MNYRHKNETPVIGRMNHNTPGISSLGRVKDAPSRGVILFAWMLVWGAVAFASGWLACLAVR